MNVHQKVQEIEALLDQHRAFREDCLNLIASENVPSPFVERMLAAELDQRYGNYAGIDLQSRSYQGNRLLVQIEEFVHELAKELFDAAYVDLRPLSGNVAGIAAVFALASPGDTVLEVGDGHQYAAKLAKSALKLELQSVLIPWDARRYNIDLEPALSLIRQHRPRLVVLGSGRFLFPQPVREIKEAMRQANPDSFLIYDAAHVLGLVAGGRFQSPLVEGADLVISSTHKTLAGPQGGMVLTNNKSVAERIGPAIQPLLVSNHHLHRLPALAATFLEWMAFGPEHADAIIQNAKALGRALHQRGVRLVGEDLGFTESHTLIMMVDDFGEGKELADRLEECRIIAGATRLPEELGTHSIRLGVQEVTRRGMTEEDAPEIADCIVDALTGCNLPEVNRRVTAMARRFNQIRFSLE